MIFIYFCGLIILIAILVWLYWRMRFWSRPRYFSFRDYLRYKNLLWVTTVEHFIIVALIFIGALTFAYLI